MHTLALDGVDAGYNNNQVLRNISFKAQEPSIYVVLGPNGAGKTTLFRTIAGILEPTSGSIKFDDEPIFVSKEVRRKINYLSHFNALPEEMIVSNALKFYADIEGGSAEEVLDILSLRELKDKKISDLSQGQKKRVSIAKVFLRERDLYLLDEPTSNLDPTVSKEIRDILLKLSRDRIVLYSSHNLYEARDVGTYLILIKNGAMAFFDKISNVKSRNYTVGIKTSTDITKIVDAKLGEGGYYILNVASPEEAGLVLKDLVNKGVLVTEMRRARQSSSGTIRGENSVACFCMPRDYGIIIAKRSISLSKTYIVVSVGLSAVAVSLGSVGHILNGLSLNQTLPSTSGGTIELQSVFPLISIPLMVFSALAFTTPVLLLYVYDKNNGVLEYFLSLGMDQGDVYRSYLKASLFLASILLVFEIPGNALVGLLAGVGHSQIAEIAGTNSHNCACCSFIRHDNHDGFQLPSKGKSWIKSAARDCDGRLPGTSDICDSLRLPRLCGAGRFGRGEHSCSLGSRRVLSSEQIDQKREITALVSLISQADQGERKSCGRGHSPRMRGCSPRSGPILRVALDQITILSGKITQENTKWPYIRH